MTTKVALFRAREDATASAARLRRLGFSVACLPAIEIKAQAARPMRSRYDAVVATSGKAFMGDWPGDRSPPLYVVGARTGRAAKSRGWRLASRNPVFVVWGPGHSSPEEPDPGEEW